MLPVNHPKRRLGQNIKSLRQKNKLTQESFATICGTSKAIVNNIERGTTHSFTKLKNLIDYFEADTDEILAGVPSDIIASCFAEKRLKLIDVDMYNEIDLPEEDKHHLTIGSLTEVNWLCNKCAFKWESSINTRFNAVNRCVSCVGSKPKIKTKIRDTHPELFAQMLRSSKNSNKSLELGPTSIHIISFVCDFGHEWKDSPYRRINVFKAKNCPTCDNLNKLKSIEVIALEQGSSIENRDKIITGSHIEIKCNKGHRFKISLDKAEDGYWCELCGHPRKSQTKPKIDALIRFRTALSIKGFILIDEKFLGNGEYHWVECNKGHRLRKTPNWVHSNKIKNHACPKCPN